MKVTSADVALLNNGHWSSLDNIKFPAETKGFLSQNKLDVMISGDELIKLGGDPKVIMDHNYAFVINKSVQVLEVTKTIEIDC